MGKNYWWDKCRQYPNKTYLTLLIIQHHFNKFLLLEQLQKLLSLPGDAHIPFHKLQSICWEGTSGCNLRFHQIHLIAFHMDYEINMTTRGPLLNCCLNSKILPYALDTTSLIAFFRHISLPLKNTNSTGNYFWCVGQKRYLLFNFQEWEWFSSIYLICLTGI